MPATGPSAAFSLSRVVGPDTARAGSTLVIEGTGFGTALSDSRITIAGVSAQVLSATSTRLEVQLPAAELLPCVATGSQPLRITSRGQTGELAVTLSVARRISLARGESLNLLSANESLCHEYVATDGDNARYVMAVINTSVIPSQRSGFQVRASSVGGVAPSQAPGQASAESASFNVASQQGPQTQPAVSPAVSSAVSPAVSSAGSPAVSPAVSQSLPHVTTTQSLNTSAHNFENASLGASITTATQQSLTNSLTQSLHEHTSHSAHLTRENSRAAQYGSATTAWRNETTKRARNAGRSAYAATALTEGATVQRNAMFSACESAQNITARAVYVGQHIVVLEDAASPRAGTMDAQLRDIGREFDTVMYPLLVEQVGNPLALNDIMQGDARISMLVSPYVNNSAPGTSGYVTTCNLYPRSSVPNSNEDELFYVRTPHVTETIAAWQRTMRSTVLHEAKHLASFAQRMATGAEFEEPWMEEATARIAEELYARTFDHGQGNSRAAWKSNTGWSASVMCEVYECDGRPLMMWRHISVLHDYFAGADTLSPLGSASNNDHTYYASGWSLVRWAIDHYAINEASFLRDLVRGGDARGVALLESRTGRPAAELLAEWALANLVDDYPDFTPARATLSMPSWNLPQLMAGLAGTFGGRYSARPINVREITGERQVSVAELRGFGAAYLETGVSAGAAQLVELRGAGGERMAGNLRLAVVRVR